MWGKFELSNFMNLEVINTDLNLKFYISPTKVKIHLKSTFAKSIGLLNLLNRLMNLNLVFFLNQ